MKKNLHDRAINFYIENTCHKFPNFLTIYIAKYIVVIYCIRKVLQEPDWHFVSTLEPKITPFYLLSFVFLRCTTRCHLLLLIVIVVIRCHSLSLVVTRCHSLSLVVPTRCHSLYYSLLFVLPLVVTRCRCATRLSF